MVTTMNTSSVFDVSADQIRELGAIIRGDAPQSAPTPTDSLREAQEAATHAKNEAVGALSQARGAIEGQIEAIRAAAGDVLSIEARNAIAACSAAAANVDSLMALVESGNLTAEQARHCVEAAHHAVEMGSQASAIGRAGQANESFKENAEFKLETFEQIQQAWTQLEEKRDALIQDIFSDSDPLYSSLVAGLEEDDRIRYLQERERRADTIERLQATQSQYEEGSLEHMVIGREITEQAREQAQADVDAAILTGDPELIKQANKRLADVQAQAEQEATVQEAAEKKLLESGVSQEEIDARKEAATHAANEAKQQAGLAAQATTAEERLGRANASRRADYRTNNILTQDFDVYENNVKSAQAGNSLLTSLQSTEEPKQPSTLLSGGTLGLSLNLPKAEETAPRDAVVTEADHSEPFVPDNTSLPQPRDNTMTIT